MQPSAVQSRVSEGTPNIAENKDFARLIVGSWQGDHNRTLCFAKDGSYRCDPGEVRGGWKIDGEKLLIAFTAGKSFNAPIVSLTDTTLVLAGRRHTDEYTRIKP